MLLRFVAVVVVVLVVLAADELFDDDVGEAFMRDVDDESETESALHALN